jgi:glutamate-ammonia-ligase adenylyltransferase
VQATLERLVERGGEAAALLAEPGSPLGTRVVAVAGASRSLARLLVAEPDALRTLTSPDVPVGFDDVRDADELARRKSLELLRIAARDLCGEDALEEVGARLARLADAVLDTACRIAGAEGLAVVGMGKHGAEELNYASDVDVVLVAEAADVAAEAAARRMLDVARRSFRVDADLRPEGRAGPLVRSLASYRAYWQRWARPWEFQALLKARAAAGARDLGAEFAAAAAEAVWGRSFDADDLAELRRMKARAESLVHRRGLDARELKLGPGGIRDVEFAVQILQLVHGRRDPALRLRATLPALAELTRAGYVAREDGTALALAYRFLRVVEHRLQLLEETQVHALPTSRQALEEIAVGLGFAESGAEALARFEQVLAAHRGAARRAHERLFFRPLLEAYGGEAAHQLPAVTEAAPAPDVLSARLEAFGFRDATRTREALAELTRGMTRSSRLMQQLLPVLLGWLSETPDPDLGLLSLRNLAGTPHRRDALVATFRDSPVAARRLCRLLGTSRRLGEIVARRLDLLAALADDRGLEARPPHELREAAAVAADQTPARRGRALRTFVDLELGRVAARDLLGLADADAVGRELAVLGEAVLSAACYAARPAVPFVVVAMGRLGGEELAYGSDLDVQFVHGGCSPSDQQAAEQAALDLLRLCNGPTPAERVWTVDADLRPEGRAGPLVRSLDACSRYYERWAEPWERQALLRARPVAGDPEVATRFADLARSATTGRSVDEDEVRELRRMRARVERERIPPGEDPQFHLKLGRGSLADVEWTVQLLQLRHRVAGARTPEALRSLVAAGCLARADAATLADAYRFLGATRNRWHLVGGFFGTDERRTGADSLPPQPMALTRLARSLETTPAELRETYRRVTRRARQVVERLFYEGR